MKITTNLHFEAKRTIHPEGVLPFFLDRAENRGFDSSKDRRRERAEALEGVVSRLLIELIGNGTLRANHVERIFDYDVSAED